MIINLKIFIYKHLFEKLRFWYLLYCDRLLRKQFRNPASIPIIIINFNQLFYLEKLVDFLLKRKFENIIIIDNKSTYEPLLEYYQQLPKNVTVEYMEKNYAHLVFFKNTDLQEKYGKGFYVVTDADIVPNENLPENFLNTMLKILIKHKNQITKVGFALAIDDIPDYFPKKKEVLNWETKFWKDRTNERVESYYASIDTTFALYKPGFPSFNNKVDFFKAIRVADLFVAEHGGWYVDYANLSEEQQNYQNTSSSVSSWLIDTKGQLNEKYYKKYL